jgi:hypothetical protein
MAKVTAFRCFICKQCIVNPHTCLNRRVEKVDVLSKGGNPVTTIHIADSETIFMYCSNECWQTHQPAVISALELKQTFPAFNFVTPCCRCDNAVNRTQLYICYSLLKMNFENGETLAAKCLDDVDFAVLCSVCENLEHQNETDVEVEERFKQEEATV